MIVVVETETKSDRSSRRSLKVRATAFTLAIFVLGISALSIFVSRSLQADMEQLLGEQQFSVVTSVAKTVNDDLTERLQALQTVAKDMDAALLARPTALQARLEQRPLLQLQFNGGVFVTGLEYVSVASVPLSIEGTSRIGINYSGRDFLATALRDGKVAIGKPVMGKLLKSPIVVMAVPIFDSQGKVVGALAGVTDLGKPNFLDKITQSMYGKSGGYFLIDLKHRMVVTATDKNRVMQALPAPGINPLIDRFIGGYEGYAVLVNAVGVGVLSSSKVIPVAGWAVSASLPTAEAFAPLQHRQQRLLWATLVLAALVGALTWLVLRREIAPLVVAAKAMTKLANSKDMPQPLPEAQPGEIGELMAGFNRILEKSIEREGALAASETFKDAVLDSLDAEIAVVDRNGVIQAVNARWQRFALENSPEAGRPALRTGVGASYLAACDGGSGADAENISVVRAGLQSVLDGRLPRFSHEYPCDSPQQQRWFSMVVMPLGHDGVVVAHTDITARKQAEVALQRGKEMLERTESMAHLASFAWDVDTNAMTWSTEMFRIFGRDPALGTPNLQGQTELYTPESTQTLFDAVGKAVADGTPYELELMSVQPDGEQRPCWVKGFPERDDSGRVVRIDGLVQDITERKAAQEKLQLAAGVFTHALEGIMITTPEAVILDVNDAFTRITGYTRDEVRGQSPRILSSGRHDADYYAAMWRRLAQDGYWYGEVWNRRKNGEVFAEMQAISAMRDAQGKVSQYISLFSDITERKAHESQLEHIAHFDALTNLPNRVLLADRLQQAMAQAQRRQLKLAVVYLDLDGFKAINDHHGHQTGDQVLITLAQRMKEALREGDTLGRIGGDEFVAVLIDLQETQSSVPLLGRLLSAAAEPVQAGESLQVSASLGVTFYPQAHDLDADQLLRQADQAMYQAKLAGKNRYHVFDAALDTSLRSHHETLERIRLALENHEFVLHYQPKVNMHTGQVLGVEALIRWRHPENGLLAPATFLPVIEDHTLAVEVGEWVIDTAMHQMELWHAAGLDLPVSVNVGARQLQQANFVERLQAILARHPQVQPGCIELEVLETSALADMEQVSQVIEDCARIGVRFALDDFGTGSSLTYLKRLRVALLKIDQSFVRDMLDDPDDMAILQGVIGLAAAFKREVIAEGVETVAHGTALLQLGCELAQGYGIARPMPPEQMPAWVASWQPDVAWCELPWLGSEEQNAEG